MKFDFNHIDPRTGLPRMVASPDDNIQLITRMPARSCYIRMLQNRASLRSVGNIRYAQRLWYNARAKTLHTAPDAPVIAHWYNYRLPNHQRAAGWIEDRYI